MKTILQKNLEQLQSYIDNETVLEIVNLNNEIDAEFLSGLETGMHVKLRTFADNGDDVLRAVMDTRGFDEQNDPLLKKDYFDSNKKPTLDAKEAGAWSDYPEIYLDSNTPIDHFFVPVSGPELELRKIHEEKNDGSTFRQFLLAQACLNNDIEPPVVQVKTKVKTQTPSI